MRNYKENVPENVGGREVNMLSMHCMSAKYFQTKKPLKLEIKL